MKGISMGMQIKWVGRARQAVRAEILMVAASVTVASIMSPVFAGSPIQGEHVVAGNAQFTRNGPITTIRASNRAIIEYQRFNIPSGNSVVFVQPSAKSTVLNRITGADPTTIDGMLKANGILYFVNPAGVVFGPHSIVDAGGFYAAAGNVNNQDFLGGINRFSPTGPVSNQGMIHAGDVGLFGRMVTNEGTIKTDSGTVTLAAGNEVFVGNRDGGIYVKMSAQNTPTTGTGVYNSGTIQGGSVKLAAGDLYSLAVKNTGNITAKSIEVSGGKSPVVISGTLDASDSTPGAKGGSVVVTGSQVDVTSATINASGDAGGGAVRVGGDFHGKGAIPTADVTNVSADSTIHADAINSGDGGTVVVWSDKLTNFGGAISARGGATRGNGGLVEVSSKVKLSFVGTVDTSAQAGAAGTLLLDPAVLTIGDSGDVTPAMIVGELDSTNVSLVATSEIDVVSAVDNSGHSGGFDLSLSAPLVSLSAPIRLVSGGLTVNASTQMDLNLLASINVDHVFTLNSPLVNVSTTNSVTASGGITSNATQANIHHFGSIQTGVNLVTGSGTVSIDDGSYQEHVTISKAVTLSVPTGTATVDTIDASGAPSIQLGGNFASTVDGFNLPQTTLVADTALDSQSFATVGSVTGHQHSLEVSGPIVSLATVTGVNNLNVLAGTAFTSPAIGATGSVTLRSQSNLTIGGNIGASSVTATGDNSLNFGAGVEVDADTQQYLTGNGFVDVITNRPQFRNGASGAPTHFTIGQDGSIGDLNIADVSQFGGNAPANYSLISNGGIITLTDGSKVSGSALTLNASGVLTIGMTASVASLDASGGDHISLSGANITSSGSQNYHSSVKVVGDSTLAAGENSSISFGGSLDGPASLTATANSIMVPATIGANAPLQNLSLTNGSADLTIGSITANGEVDLSTSGSILQTGGTIMANTLSLSGNQAVGTSAAPMVVNLSGSLFNGFALAGFFVTSPADLTVGTIVSIGSQGLLLHSNGNMTAGPLIGSGAFAATAGGTLALVNTVQGSTFTAVAGGNISQKATLQTPILNFTAGNGAGSATVSFTFGEFQNTTSLTVVQDGSIADTDIPRKDQFQIGFPQTISLTARNGNITLSSGDKVAGTDLTLNASGVLTIGATANLNSLSATGQNVQLNGAAVTTTLGQAYHSPVISTGGANTLSAGTTISFDSTLDGPASLAMTGATVTLPANIGMGAAFTDFTARQTAGDLTVNGINASGTVSVRAGGSLIQGDGAITGTNMTLHAGSLLGTSAAPITVVAGGLVTPISDGAGIFLTSPANLHVGTIFTGGSVSISSGGDLTADSITALLNSVDLSADGIAGFGNISTVNVLTVQGVGGVSVGSVGANSATFIAGNGTTGAKVFIGGGAIFRNAGNTGTLGIFTVIQDGSIADADIPDAGQFVYAVPANYSFQSRNGGITLSTGSKLAGNNLTLNASGAATLLNLTASVASLSVTGGGGISLNQANVTSTGGQGYHSAVTVDGASTLSAGGTLNFHAALDGPMDLTITAGAAVLPAVVGGNTPFSNFSLEVKPAVDTDVTVGSITATNNLTLQDDSGSIFQSNGGLLSADSVTLAAHPNLLIGDSYSVGAPSSPIHIHTSTLSGAADTGGFYASNNQSLEIVSVSTNNGAVAISATGGGDLTVDSISAGNAPVTLNAAGKLVGTQAGATPEITTSGLVTLIAGASIGDNADGRIVISGNQFVVDSNVNVFVGGDNSTTLASGTLRVAPAGSGTYDVNGFNGLTFDVTTDGTNLTINNLAGGGVHVVAKTGNVIVGSFDAGNSPLDLSSPSGSLTFGSITGGAVSLSAPNGGVSGTLVVGTSLAVTATGDVTLTTIVSSLTVVDNTSGGGDIHITNTGPLTLNGVTSTGGTIDISSHSPLSVGAPIVAAGDIMLTAGNDAVNPADDLTISANVHSTGGNVFLNAGDNIIQTAGTITSDTGLVHFKAGIDGSGDGVDGGITQSGGGISAASGLAVESVADANLDGGTNTVAAIAANVTGGAFRYVDTGSILVGTVDGINGVKSGGFVGMTATAGSITQNPGANVTANGATLMAGTSITLTEANDLNFAGTGNGAISANGNVTINSTSGLSFATVASETGDINITASATTFTGAVTGNSLTVNGATQFAGGSTNTTAGQTYGAVTLSANADLTGTDLTLGTVTGGGFDLGLHGSGDTQLVDVNNVGALVSDNGGTTELGGVVSGTSLNITDAVAINGGSVSTTGNQTYGAATLGGITNFTGAAVTFASTLDAAGTDLSIPGDLTLDDTVTNLNSLSVSGKTTLGVSSLTTTLGQTYIGGLVLTVDTTLSAGNASAINWGSLDGGGKSLGAAAGTMTLGSIGKAGSLSLTASTVTLNAPVTAGSLTIHGSTLVNGGTVTTTGLQTYTAAVSLGANATFAGTNLTFSTVDAGSGGFDFVLHGTGTTSLFAVNNVGALVSDAGGTTVLHNSFSAGSVNISDAATISGGGNITTTAGQAYAGGLRLGANTTLSGTNLTLNTVNGGATPSFGGSGGFDGFNLTLHGTGLTIINGATALNHLISDAGGTTRLTNVAAASVVSEDTTISGFINTSAGPQTYSSTTLAGDASLTGTNITLNAITGGGFNIAVLDSGVTRLSSGANLGALSIGGPGLLFNSGRAATSNGSTVITGPVTAVSVTVTNATTMGAGTVNTTAGQTYTDAMTLTADLSLSAGGTIALFTVDGANSFTAMGSSFGQIGALGGATPLTAVILNSTSAAADLTLPPITSTGAISLTSARSIFDGVAFSDPVPQISPHNIIATPHTLTFIAANAIGTTAIPINTTVGALNATAGAGGVNISQSGAATLGTIVSGGIVVINDSTGNLTIAKIAAGVNSVSLSTNGSILDDNDQSTGITAGTLTLVATGGNIGASGNADIDARVSALNASGGTITLTNNSAAINLNSVVATGAVTLTASGNMTVTSVIASPVTLTAGGAIADDGSATSRIVAPIITLSAGAGINAKVNAPTITANTTGGNLTLVSLPTGSAVTATLSIGSGSAGDITFSQGTGKSLTIASAVAPNGSVTITNTGGALTLTSVSGSGTVTASTVTSGDLLAASVSGNVVSLTSAGAISSAGDGAVDVTGLSSTFLAASTGVGPMNILTPILSVTNSASGDVDLHLLGAKSAGAGDVAATVTNIPGNITFASDTTGKTSLSASGQTLALTTGGDATVRSAITLLAASIGGSFSFTNDGAVTIGSNSQGVSAAGNILLDAGKETITLAGVDVSSANGHIELDSPVAVSGNVNLRSRRLNSKSVAGSNLAFTGDGTLTIALPSNFTPTAGSRLATIVTPGDFTFNAHGGFTGTLIFDVSQKLAAGGDIVVNADTVELRDLLGVGNVSISAGHINFHHTEGSANIIAGQQLFFSGTRGGDIGALDFADTDGLPGSGGFNLTSVQYHRNVPTIPPLAITAQGDAIVPLAAGPLGGASSDSNSAAVTNALASALPHEEPVTANDVIAIVQDINAIGVSSDELTKLGINVRNARPDELIELVVGRAYYDDAPHTPGTAESDYRLVKARLSFTTALAAVQDYHELVDDIDPQTGKPRPGDDGKPLTRIAQIHDTFNASYAAFRTSGGAAGDAGAFRTYIMTSPDQAQTRGYLVSLQRVISDIRHLGLPARYDNAAFKATLKELHPADLTSDQFLSVVDPQMQVASR
jgi:filamentous hemagglutinin family protein